jgi:SPP1 gp7 family putative phage head morphogenesis protein
MCVVNEVIGTNTNGAEEIEAPETGISEEFLALYSLALFDGIITEYSLSYELYEQTALYLERGINRSYKDIGLTLEEKKLLDDLKRNAWHFSAAKQYTQNREILSAISPLERGNFTEFKKVTDQILPKYNNDWLKTEYRTAVANSQGARDWITLQQDSSIQFIEYVTQGDSLVRPGHRVLNHAVYPKNHSFWNNHFPPNGWNCRCFTVNHDEETKLKEVKDLPEWDTNDFPKAFKTNPGKSGVIYPRGHPYFRIAQGDKVFRNANYGLPLPPETQ